MTKIVYALLVVIAALAFGLYGASRRIARLDRMVLTLSKMHSQELRAKNFCIRHLAEFGYKYEEK